MIAALLLSAIIAGLDNLQVGAALGLLPIPRRRLAHFAIAFTVAETVAPLLGMLCGKLLFATIFSEFQFLGPVVLCGCGAALFILLWRQRDVSVLIDRPGMVVALALSLSYDNFLLGLGLGSVGVAVLPAVVATGVICGLMSCLGLYGASGARRFLPRGAGAVASLALCALGAHALVAG
jgi:putative Mn2+ efflux pump MntP